MLFLLLESALRSALFGLFVWTALKLTRLKDPATEAMVWTLVLLAAWAMPFLAPLQAEGPALTLEPWWHTDADAPQLAASAGSIEVSWLASHAMRLAETVYGAIVLWNLARLATGLILSWRLCRKARKVTKAWAQDHNIRTSIAVESPFSLGCALFSCPPIAANGPRPSAPPSSLMRPRTSGEAISSCSCWPVSIAPSSGSTRLPGG